MAKNIELRAPKVPEIFSRATAGLTTGILGELADHQRQETRAVINFLNSAEVNQAIADQSVTFAMIKPRLDQYMDPATAQVAYPGDPELAQYLTGEMESAGLNPLIAVSFTMNMEMLEEFYGGKPKANMQKETLAPGYTRWDQFTETMQSGPVTFILLQSRGDAIEKWRQVMGTTYDVAVLKETQPKSLRAKARGNDNNLLHGSDSQKSVTRERNFVVKILKSLLG